mmetsp:Transcript_5903/g.19844  ORF Transcript_5903/g.19844 Transcript_5903/m.19844 type:complete len:401 (-) Transcript_5903:429-1631(-)
MPFFVFVLLFCFGGGRGPVDSSLGLLRRRRGLHAASPWAPARQATRGELQHQRARMPRRARLPHGPQGRVPREVGARHHEHVEREAEDRHDGGLQRLGEVLTALRARHGLEEPNAHLEHEEACQHRGEVLVRHGHGHGGGGQGVYPAGQGVVGRPRVRQAERQAPNGHREHERAKHQAHGQLPAAALLERALQRGHPRKDEGEHGALEEGVRQPHAQHHGIIVQRPQRRPPPAPALPAGDGRAPGAPRAAVVLHPREDEGRRDDGEPQGEAEGPNEAAHVRGHLRQHPRGDGRHAVARGGQRKGGLEQVVAEAPGAVLCDVPRLEGAEEQGGGDAAEHAPEEEHPEVGAVLHELDDHLEGTKDEASVLAAHNVNEHAGVRAEDGGREEAAQEQGSGVHAV